MEPLSLQLPPRIYQGYQPHSNRVIEEVEDGEEETDEVKVEHEQEHEQGQGKEQGEANDNHDLDLDLEKGIIVGVGGCAGDSGGGSSNDDIQPA